MRHKSLETDMCIVCYSVLDLEGEGTTASCDRLIFFKFWQQEWYMLMNVGKDLYAVATGVDWPLI